MECSTLICRGERIIAGSSTESTRYFLLVPLIEWVCYLNLIAVLIVNCPCRSEQNKVELISELKKMFIFPKFTIPHKITQQNETI